MVSLSSKRGSVLVFAVGTIIILSILTFYIGMLGRSRLDFVGRMEKRENARAIAESGAYGVIDQIKTLQQSDPGYIFFKMTGDLNSEKLLGYEYKTDDIKIQLSYNCKIDISGGSVYCKIGDEQGKLNINTADFDAVKRLITITTGAKEEDAGSLAGAMIDWRDNDNEMYGDATASSENIGYSLANVPYGPKNSLYQSVEELLFVKGMTFPVFKGLEPFITVYGDGRVNINTSSAYVLEAMGLSRQTAENIDLFRRGGRSGKTGFFRVFKSQPEIIFDLEKVFTLPDGDRNTLLTLLGENKLSTDSFIFRITSIGSFHGDFYEIQCIYDRTGSIQYWAGDAKKIAVL